MEAGCSHFDISVFSYCILNRMKYWQENPIKRANGKSKLLHETRKFYFASRVHSFFVWIFYLFSPQLICKTKSRDGCMQLPYYNASFISFPDPLSCRHRVMTSGVVQLSRTVRTQNELYEFYGKPSPSSKPLLQNIEEKCSTSAVASYILSLFPIIHVIKTYKFRKYIVDDVISGISAACLHFPQGLAFGILASLTPAYGLYTSFFPVLLYVFFGTS